MIMFTVGNNWSISSLLMIGAHFLAPEPVYSYKYVCLRAGVQLPPPYQQQRPVWLFTFCLDMASFSSLYELKEDLGKWVLFAVCMRKGCVYHIKLHWSLKFMYMEFASCSQNSGVLVEHAPRPSGCAPRGVGWGFHVVFTHRSVSKLIFTAHWVVFSIPLFLHSFSLPPSLSPSRSLLPSLPPLLYTQGSF